MPHPEQETPPALYTAEQLYTLLDARANLKERLALARMFDASPYNLDGIAVYVTPPAEGNDETSPGTICFNGQLTEAEMAGLRKPDETTVTWGYGKPEPLLQERQERAKQPVRSLPQLLGSLGISGAAGGVSGLLLEVLVSDASARAETTVGLLMAGATYFTVRLWMERRQLREAQQSVDALRDQCLDSEEGCITFLRDKVYSYPVGGPKANSSEEGLNAVLEELWALPLEITGKYAVDSHVDSEGARSIDIKLGQFIKNVLKNNVAPGEAWHEYLEEQATMLSEQEFLIEDLEAEIARLEHVRAFTGYTDDGELGRCRGKLQGARAILVGRVGQVIRWSEGYVETRARRQRVAAAEALISPGPVITGAGIQTHPYDPQMRPLIRIVADSLSRLELTEQSTIDLAKAIAEYLEGTRAKLWMSRMQYFYQGLHTKFSAHLPDLPTWEEAKALFVPPSSSASKDA